jgi:hypothetical protein
MRTLQMSLLHHWNKMRPPLANAIAWTGASVVFGLLLVIDSALRRITGNNRTGGIPNAGSDLFWLLFALLFFVLALRGAAPIRNMWLRIFASLLHTAAALALFLFLGLLYVVGSGIDGL